MLAAGLGRGGTWNDGKRCRCALAVGRWDRLTRWWYFYRRDGVLTCRIGVTIKTRRCYDQWALI